MSWNETDVELELKLIGRICEEAIGMRRNKYGGEPEPAISMLRDSHCRGGEVMVNVYAAARRTAGAAARSRRRRRRRKGDMAERERKVGDGEQGGNNATRTLHWST